MRDCGDRTPPRPPADVKNDASEEFARQARELVASLESKSDHERRSAIEAELDRFEQPRYALVAAAALDALRSALAKPVGD